MNQFCLWGCISLTILVIALVWSVWIKPRLQNLSRTLSSLNVFTLGVFFAGVCLFVPVIHQEFRGSIGDYATTLTKIIYTFFWSVVNSTRLFVLGIDPDVVKKAIALEDAQIQTFFSLYAALIYFLAPAMTFTNVLTIFSNFVGSLRLRLCWFRNLYVMSELNAQSMALAQDIVNQKKVFLFRPLIVFADVFARNEEQDYELQQSAKRLSAICLKTDVSHLHFATLGRSVEIFLLGANETENVAHAISLSEQLQNKPRKFSIYVYAPMDYADHILDSMFVNLEETKKSKREHPYLPPHFQKWAATHSADILTEKEWMQKCTPTGNRLSIRRIDPVDVFVKKALTFNDYQDYLKIYQEAETDKTISITILGMGRYGSHFLKTAVWFYQHYGYRVEINVVDIGAENGDIQKRMIQECPELVTKRNLPHKDDAQYDIRFFLGVDCMGADLSVLLQNSERFAKTKLVFIALGEDDLNIQAAMNLRTAFDRMRYLPGTKSTGDFPFIYTVIYDDQKVANLGADRWGNRLTTHKQQSYGIRFLSTLALQYSYQVINDSKQLEERAFRYHLDWSRKESQLRIYYEFAQQNASPSPKVDLALCKSFQKDLDQELQGAAPQWQDDGFIQYHKNNSQIPFSLNLDILNKKAEGYIKYAYNRNSSIAKAVHKAALARLPGHQEEHFDLCPCSFCNDQRRTEHMRWNAYIRSQGYIYGDGRCTRAKIHADLIPWKALPFKERYKD